MDKTNLIAKKTLTSNIAELFTKNLVSVTDAEYFYTQYDDRKPLDKDLFVKSLLALNDAGIFSDSPDFSVVEIPNSNEEDFILQGFLRERGHKQLRAITVKLVVNDREKIEEVSKKLKRY